MVTNKSLAALGRSPMAGLASQLFTKLLQWSKRFIGWLILGIWGLIAIYTAAAVASIALQTSIQTQNFIQNWTKDAHTNHSGSDKWGSSRWNTGNKNSPPMSWRSVNRFTKTSYTKMWLEFYSILYYPCSVQL